MTGSLLSVLIDTCVEPHSGQGFASADCDILTVKDGSAGSVTEVVRAFAAKQSVAYARS